MFVSDTKIGKICCLLMLNLFERRDERSDEKIYKRKGDGMRKEQVYLPTNIAGKPALVN